MSVAHKVTLLHQDKEFSVTMHLEFPDRQRAVRDVLLVYPTATVVAVDDKPVYVCDGCHKLHDSADEVVGDGNENLACVKCLSFLVVGGLVAVEHELLAKE